MRTFFFKIFIWFWFAMVLVVLTAVAVTFTLQPSGAVDRWQRLAASPFRVAAVGAVNAYENNGARGANSYLARLRRDTGVHAYLFDSTGHELSRLHAPSIALKATQRAGMARTWQLGAGTVTTAIAQRLGGTQHRRYVLVVVERVSLPFHDRSVWIRFLAVTLTGGLICAWLARSISAPIADLRRTARRIASGDLSARAPRGLKRRGDEISQFARDFDGMADHLETLITAQQRLLADISHELRSPLARLGVAVAIAKRSSPGDAHLERIEREAERLNDLIGQLTTLSKLESGVEARPFEPVDVAQLLSAIVSDADFEAKSQSKGVTFSSSDATAAVHVDGNPELLRRGLENVVRNAVRYTPIGADVAVTLSKSEAGVEIQVRDHGPGVPESALTEIFRPFYRLEDDRGRETGGAGLGLAIADRAIRAHNGSIKAENATGGGLIVSVVISTP